MEELIGTPTPTHIVYIPAILLLGAVVGFIFGRKVGVKEGQSNFLGGGSDLDDDLL